MKKLLTFLFTVLILTIGCESPDITQTTFIQEKQMSDFANFTLTESQNSTDVMCLSELTYLPENAKSATLYINEKLVAGYGLNEDLYDNYKKAVFQLKDFGEVNYKIIFKDIDDVEIETVTDKVSFNIETFFICVKADESGQQTILNNEDTKEMFSLARARGNHDISWMYFLRVPTGKKVKFHYLIDKINDSRSTFNGEKMDIHFRLVDYKDRNDLYIAPDEAKFHIDKEIDKWITESVEFESGIYTLYIAPSKLHDLSFLTVYMTGDLENSVTGYSKSLDYPALGDYPEN